MEDRLIRLPEVISITGLKRSKIYQLSSDGNFPKRIVLDRTTVWLEREVRAWVQQRIAERDRGEAERKETGERLRAARAKARQDTASAKAAA